jgi:hypothetical protein
MVVPRCGERLASAAIALPAQRDRVEFDETELWNGGW